LRRGQSGHGVGPSVTVCPPKPSSPPRPPPFSSRKSGLLSIPGVGGGGGGGGRSFDTPLGLSLFRLSIRRECGHHSHAQLELFHSGCARPGNGPSVERRARTLFANLFLRRSSLLLNAFLLLFLFPSKFWGKKNRGFTVQNDGDSLERLTFYDEWWSVFTILFGEDCFSPYSHSLFHSGRGIRSSFQFSPLRLQSYNKDEKDRQGHLNLDYVNTALYYAWGFHSSELLH